MHALDGNKVSFISLKVPGESARNPLCTKRIVPWEQTGRWRIGDGRGSVF